MNSNRIENRITDLLKLAGLTDGHVIEEMTDHYLTHIDEEVRRGVNSQQAIRETFQEIANIDPTLFKVNESRTDKKGLLVFFLLFIGISIYFINSSSQQDVTIPQKEIDKQEQAIHVPTKKISALIPPTGSPVHYSDFKITSDFGMRMHPIQKQKELHRGIDIRAKMGTAVLATGDGIIKAAGFKKKAGNYLTIQHEGDFQTKYYHLSYIAVTENEKVDEGQLIGKVGNSGLSKMPHLHYEVLKNNVPVNPRDYIGP